jgi:hypothetical protein
MNKTVKFSEVNSKILTIRGQQVYLTATWQHCTV